MKSSTELVSELADALNAHDMEAAKRLISDDICFEGVFGAPISGAESYLAAMGRLGARQTIRKLIADDTDVACFYDLHLSGRPDLSLFGCGWFKISNGRIASIRIVFDPTPLHKP